jgi:hypothetical protein
MKKKTLKRPLVLSRETLAILDAKELSQAAGGDTAGSECPTLPPCTD